MTHTPSDIQTRLQDTDRIIHDLLAATPPAGFALGIVHQGETVYQHTSGYANIEKHTPVTPDTVFRIGSISKTFTAVAILQLWEQGLIDLHAPVNDYLHAFGIHPPSPDAPPITIHHLLSHTSGMGRGETIAEMIDVIGHFTGWWHPRVDSLNELYGARGLHPMVPADTKYSYSNNGYAVLGQIVADVTGMSFTDYLRQHIFDPCGMTRSDSIMSERVLPTLAVGYRGSPGDYIPIRPTEITQQGAGGILSSLNDMMAFARAFLAQDTRIMQPDTWQFMQQPNWQLHPLLWMNASGLMVKQYDGFRRVEHGGGAGGFNAHLVFSPSHDLALVALSSRHLTMETYTVNGHLLKHLLTIPEPPTVEDRIRLSENAPRDHWHELVGYYAPSPGWKTNFDHFLGTGFTTIHAFAVIEDDRLLLRGGPFGDGVRLIPDPDEPLYFYSETSGKLYIFQRNAAGQIDRLICDEFIVMHRTSPERHLPTRIRRWLRYGAVSFALLALLWLFRRRIFRQPHPANG